MLELLILLLLCFLCCLNLDSGSRLQRVWKQIGRIQMTVRTLLNFLILFGVLRLLMGCRNFLGGVWCLSESLCVCWLNQRALKGTNNRIWGLFASCWHLCLLMRLLERSWDMEVMGDPCHTEGVPVLIHLHLDWTFVFWLFVVRLDCCYLYCLQALADILTIIYLDY